MYAVSNAFLNAVKANTRKYYWTGRITTKAGTVIEFDQEDMVKGSGYITSQCCGSSRVCCGDGNFAILGNQQVYAGRRNRGAVLSSEDFRQQKQRRP